MGISKLTLALQYIKHYLGYINSSEFTYTTNTTRSNNNLENPPTIRVSDIGIYDSDGDLVIISKLSNPISLVSGSNVMVELSIDF